MTILALTALMAVFWLAALIFYIRRITRPVAVKAATQQFQFHV